MIAEYSKNDQKIINRIKKLLDTKIEENKLYSSEVSAGTGLCVLHNLILAFDAKHPPNSKYE